MTTDVARPQEEAATQRGPTPRQRELRLFVIGTVIPAAILLSASGVYAAHGPAPPGWRVGLAVLLCILGNAPVLSLRFGRDGASFTYAEAAVVLTIPLLPAPWLLLVATASVAVVDALSRVPFRKVVFNAGMMTISLGVAELVAHAIAAVPLSGMPTVRQIAALVAALAVFALIQNFSVAVVVAFSQRLPVPVVVRRALRVRILVATGNIVAGLSVLLLARWDWHTLVPLPPLAVTLFGAYRGYLVVTESRDSWQRLEIASKDLAQLDETALAEAALRHAEALFRTDWAELALDGSDQLPARGYRRESTAHLPAAESPQGDVEESAGTSVFVVKLRHHGREFGALRIGFHGSVKLGDRETWVLSSFAHSIGAAVANAQLYAGLRLEAERREFEANHDSLTGLANRRMLLTAATAAVSRLAAGRVCALLLVDLDHFKEINETLGRAAGDRLLCEMSERLAGLVGERGIVARPGGDEFVVLLPNVRDDDVEYAATELLRKVTEPVLIEGVRLSVEGSIGIACYPVDCVRPEELLQRADVAVTWAKKSAGSFRRYRSADDESSVDRLALVADLRAALESDELVVHFQPQLDVGGLGIVCAEALIRWRHPTRGLLVPDDFISIVEQSGLARPFTQYVLNVAVGEAALWRRGGHTPQLSVNLSARNLLDPQLPDDVGALLRRHGVPSSSLILEITETTMVSQLDVVEDVLTRLRALGVELAVDDFGTGYSSLALLQRVRVNEVKVDKSFVLGMLSSDNDRAIVRATVELAHSLGLRVVAEGVESEELLAVITTLGCDRAQGFHIGVPMPADGMRSVLDLTRTRAPRGVPLPSAGWPGWPDH